MSSRRVCFSQLPEQFAQGARRGPCDPEGEPYGSDALVIRSIWFFHYYDVRGIFAKYLNYIIARHFLLISVPL